MHTLSCEDTPLFFLNFKYQPANTQPPHPTRCCDICKTIARVAKDTYPDEVGICGQKLAFQSELLYPPEMRFLQKTD